MKASRLLPTRLVLQLRALSAALVLVFGAAQTLPALHFLLVSHSVCAEHGELVHEGEAPERAAPAGSLREGRLAALVARAAVEHAHEHCGALAPLHAQGLAVAERAPDGLGASFSQESSVAPPRLAYCAIALLLYAPKLAPPSAFG